MVASRVGYTSVINHFDTYLGDIQSLIREFLKNRASKNEKEQGLTRVSSMYRWLSMVITKLGPFHGLKT